MDDAAVDAAVDVAIEDAVAIDVLMRAWRGSEANGVVEVVEVVEVDEAVVPSLARARTQASALSPAR